MSWQPTPSHAAHGATALPPHVGSDVVGSVASTNFSNNRQPSLFPPPLAPTPFPPNLALALAHPQPTLPPTMLHPGLGSLFAPHPYQQSHPNSQIPALPTSLTPTSSSSSSSMDAMTSRNPLGVTLPPGTSNLGATTFNLGNTTLPNALATPPSAPSSSSSSSSNSLSLLASQAAAAHRISDTDEQKRRRLEKSKLHSRETRRRNKAKMQYLEERVAVLEAENDFLRMQVARLEEEAALRASASGIPCTPVSTTAGMQDVDIKPVNLGQKRPLEAMFSSSSTQLAPSTPLPSASVHDAEDSESGRLSRVSRAEAEEWSEVPSDASQAVAAAISGTSNNQNADGQCQNSSGIPKSGGASTASYNLISFTQARCSQLLSRVDALLADNNPKHMATFVDEYIDQVAVYGRSRQAAINYCLNQILNLLHLNSDTRFIFWAAMQRKVWQNRRNGIFKMFIDSIQLSDKQIQQLVAVSDRVHDILLDWRKTGELFQSVHGTLKETSERVHTLIKKELLPLLTPRQVILYLRWIEMNPAVNEMIKTLVPAFDLPPLDGKREDNDDDGSELFSGCGLGANMDLNPGASLQPSASPTPAGASVSPSNAHATPSHHYHESKGAAGEIFGTTPQPSSEAKDFAAENHLDVPQLPAFLSAFAGTRHANDLARLAASLPADMGIAQAYEALIEHTDPATAAAAQRMMRAAAAATGVSHESSGHGDEDDSDEGSDEDEDD